MRYDPPFVGADVIPDEEDEGLLPLPAVVGLEDEAFRCWYSS